MNAYPDKIENNLVVLGDVTGIIFYNKKSYPLVRRVGFRMNAFDDLLYSNQVVKANSRYSAAGGVDLRFQLVIRRACFYFSFLASPLFFPLRSWSVFSLLLF